MHQGLIQMYSNKLEQSFDNEQLQIKEINSEIKAILEKNKEL